MMKEEEHMSFMRRAIALAIEGVESGAGGPFGAVVVKNGEIVGEGYNHVTSSCDPTAHAEIVAMREACQKMNTFQLEGCILYTSCEPCPMCFGAIYWARPDKVYYAATKEDAAEALFDDAFIYKELSLPSSNRRIPFLPLLNQEGKAPFESWMDKEDREAY